MHAAPAPSSARSRHESPPFAYSHTGSHGTSMNAWNVRWPISMRDEKHVLNRNSAAPSVAIGREIPNSRRWNR